MEKKILVAVDSFKGSLSSGEVAAACREGILNACPQAIVKDFAIADGGEGSVAAIQRAIGGRTRAVDVCGPLGESVRAHYLIGADGSTAFIEMAAATGLTLVPSESRNPLDTTTFGVGQLIADARAQGCTRFVVGIGGSATDDGGTGMLQALGFRFIDADGRTLGRGGRILGQIAAIGIPPEVVRPGEEFTVMCDVDNPLTGPQGASVVFGPQKGASPAIVRRLESGMCNYAAVIRRMGLEDVESFPGAGAAGGLGAAFKAFFGARLCRGVEVILELSGFDRALEGASLVITGEGSIDGQTLRGKAPAGVLRAASRCGVPVIAIAGNVRSARALNDAGFLAVLPVVPGPCPLHVAMRPDVARGNVTRTVTQAIRLWASGHTSAR